MEVIKLQNVSSEMVCPNTSTELQKTLAVSSAVVSFQTTDFPASCKYVRLQVQTDAVRVTYDGSNPTASLGEIVQPTQATIVSRAMALRMKFIRQATDAVIFAQPLNFLAQ